MKNQQEKKEITQALNKLLEKSIEANKAIGFNLQDIDGGQSIDAIEGSLFKEGDISILIQKPLIHAEDADYKTMKKLIDIFHADNILNIPPDQDEIAYYRIYYEPPTEQQEQQ